MKGEIGQSPFNQYKIYGPILHKKENRRIVVLIPLFPSLKRTSMSYARFIMSVFLRRELKTNEEVDHKDGDKTNDNLDNLQILSGEANRKKSFIDRKIHKKMVELKCPECQTIFVRRRGRTHLVNKGSRATFCSRRCSGKFSSKLKTKQDYTSLKNNVIKEYLETRFESE